MSSIWRFLGVLALMYLAIQPGTSVSAQIPTPSARVQALFDSLSPEERVGQLFLVNFGGSATDTDSSIYDLIARHHVGGVVLVASNDNFEGAPQTATGAYQLIARLQQVEKESTSLGEIDPATNQPVQRAYVPLFIGISQEGNGYPTDQILSGLTPLPSAMAIGATWSPYLAAEVGAIQGRELAALGFNLYFGPSLDVLEAPNPSASGDMGARVFGGDPYWVAEMGKAYVAGLHDGSRGRLLVIAKHFPGRGGSARLSEEEFSTVRKSLEQLKQIELAPFFSVTGGAPSPESAADGLVVSHIRYQGFQGNIRATTRPVSFDPQALAAILGLPQFTAWRDQGGLTVSDTLGTRAVHDFYSPGGGSYSASTVARDAFLAGNDVLYLGDMSSGASDANPYATTISILNFFTQKYREDPAFAQRVDASVLRILNLKSRVYPGLAFVGVTPPPAGLESLGTSTDATFEVARRSATLISPDRQALATVLPAPPHVRERLVFITDTLSAIQCSTCLPEESPSVSAFEEAVLRLYGPTGGNQTSSFLVSSYSLEYLRSMLDGLQPAYIEADINRADWIILSVTGSGRGQPQLISRFLSERQDLLPEKNVILFSFGAPYYFDATDISRLTAYFALYSKQPPFTDVAARLLFQELTPSGASPVSIPGIGYDLISTLTPDPTQLITLSLDLQPVAVSTGEPVTPVPTPIPLFRIGDTISLRSGVIRDHNGHAVPDGTVARFSMTLKGEGGGILQQVDAVTVQGVARASFGLDKPGLLEIRAVSDPAVVSEVLQLDVSQSGPVAVTVVVPELTQSAAASTPQSPSAPAQDGFVSVEGYPSFRAWFLSMLFVAASAWAGYWLGNRLGTNRLSLRRALGILLGGLLAYNYLVFGLPGGLSWSAANGLPGVIGIVLLGELLGFGAVWAWTRRG